MISRTVLLYLSQQLWLKELLSAIPGFNRFPRRFIAGENVQDAIEVVRSLNRLGLMATLDHLGESTTSRGEASADVQEYLRVLNLIAENGVESNISVKLTQLGLNIDEEFCYQNLLQLVQQAALNGNFVRIDMEDSSRTDATLRLFGRAYDQYPNVGIVLQSYLHRTGTDVEEVIRREARIRLCKGAYHEPEVVAFQDKEEVDQNYIRLMRAMLRSGIYHAFATHDERMINATRVEAAKIGAARDSFEFQMLYGIRRDLQLQLFKEGYRVRIYVPYGRYWYPYFMRRLAERPANVWFVLSNLMRR